MDKNKGKLILQLNAIQDYEPDFTLKLAKFNVIDDSLSLNKGLSGKRQRILLEELIIAMETLKDKPVKARYFEVSDSGEKDDHLGDHEQGVKTDRDGDDYIGFDTVPIGHFITKGEIEEVDGVSTVVAYAVLYAYNFPDQIALLEEWLSNEIKINTSCEYLYNNYEVVDDEEHIKLPIIFTAHTILNSESRGDSKVIDGAYDNSMLISMNKKVEWNSSLNTAVCQLKSEEGENNMEKEKKMLQRICQLSHDDIRYKLYSVLRDNLTANDYWDVWIYDVYDDKFIYVLWNEETSQNDYFEVTYTISEDDTITMDFEGKVEVERDWVSVSNSLVLKDAELVTALNTIKELEDAAALVVPVTTPDPVVSTNSVDADALETATNKIVDMTNEMTVMNSKLESLEDIRVAHEKTVFETALNSRKELFKVKFEALNALEKFETEEVQTMIIDSIKNETLLTSLNSMIVELVSVPKTESKEDKEDKVIANFNSKVVEDLIPVETNGVNSYFDEK